MALFAVANSVKKCYLKCAVCFGNSAVFRKRLSESSALELSEPWHYRGSSGVPAVAVSTNCYITIRGYLQHEGTRYREMV
jgi:hypothetical protein